MANTGYLGDGYGKNRWRETDDGNERSRDYDRDRESGRSWWSDDRDRASRDRNRDNDSWMSRDRDEQYRDRDHDRGFFERVGDEVSSWLGGSERERDDRNDRYTRQPTSSWERDERWNSSQRQANDRWRERGYGQSDRGESRYGGYRGADERSDQRSSEQRQSRQEYSGSGTHGSPDGFLIVEQYEVTVPSSNPDDHYRNWRDQQMRSLDRDYQDYCREREQQFHQDFSSWRQDRQGRRSQGRESGNRELENGRHSEGDRSSAGATSHGETSATKSLTSGKSSKQAASGKASSSEESTTR